jgi:serine/threonine-protein kinase
LNAEGTVRVPVLAELQRRRVFRALVGYGIASFAVLQIIEPIMHGLHWPDAVLSYVVTALAVGFPVIVSLAWIFDVNAGRIERTAPTSASGLRGVRLALLLVGIGVIAAVPGVAWFFFMRQASTGHQVSAANRRSIAVLPFASLSAGEENRYFADAIHIELLGQLAKVGDLKVISRTSVLQYREGARNLREIGEALGVSTVLEGSVQRAGSRVRIQAQLIDTASDRQIWADRYDHELTDLFLIQTAVAEDIAKALHARLLPEERSRIARQPTANAEAYDLYLRAQEYAQRPLPSPDEVENAVKLYRRAIELDPAFALAHARLARHQSLLYRYRHDHTEGRIADASKEAQLALSLQPDLAEAHEALGLVHHGRRDFARALVEFEIARNGIPDVAVWISDVQQRRARFDDALRSQEQAIALAPRSLNAVGYYYWTLIFLRRYEDAERVLGRVSSLDPENRIVPAFKASLALLSKGDAGPAKTLLRELGAQTRPLSWVNPAMIRLLELNPTEAIAALHALPDPLAEPGRFMPKALLSAVSYDAIGDARNARAGYESARIELEGAHPDAPGEEVLRCRLGRAYAGLGRKEDALRECGRAVELRPVTSDAVEGPVLLEQLAAIQAKVGDADAAIATLTGLMAIPALISAPLLRIDPKWAPLRGDPRFRRLAGLANE